ncbi:MAG: ferrous iron transport protein A [Saprospiraceae bacterium]|nr:ferrous iron transport protein A [Saprospiraceae bacterium]
MSVKLSELAIGKSAILDGFSISQLHKKMLSMGVSPGQSISVLRRLPLKGNLYVKINGRSIAFRHEEASQILVRV